MGKESRGDREWAFELPIRRAYPLVPLTLALVAIAASAWGKELADLSPTQAYRGSIETVRSVLAPYRTVMDMIVFAGTMPIRCTAAPGDRRICIWHLSDDAGGWERLAKALGTGDNLNLVCEFPSDGTGRSTDSCSAHSDCSNRSYYKERISSIGPDELKGLERKVVKRRERALTQAAKQKNREAMDSATQQLFDRSRTAFELSTLAGDAPHQCEPGKKRFLCIWIATADTYGQGTLAMIAMSAEVDFSDKVRLTCVLPADGSPRAPESCTAKSWHH